MYVRNKKSIDFLKNFNFTTKFKNFCKIWVVAQLLWLEMILFSKKALHEIEKHS